MIEGCFDGPAGIGPIETALASKCNPEFRVHSARIRVVGGFKRQDWTADPTAVGGWQFAAPQVRFSQLVVDAWV